MLAAVAAVVLAALAACAPWSQPAPPAVTSPVLALSQPSAPTPASTAPVPVSVSSPVPSPGDVAARHLLAYEDQLTPMNPADLAQELARAGDGSASPQAAMDLALLLSHTRGSGDLARAMALLDQVQRDPSVAARPWHGLARLLLFRAIEQRRAEEQIERLNQQLRDVQRDNQRKLDQLNEKLEALKAIERSINNRQQPATSGKVGP
jgi:hypothetical protein